MRFVANVLSGFDGTMGATFFDLTELQARVRTPEDELNPGERICCLPTAIDFDRLLP